ncbi:hypothetical protein [Actinoallomurus rhizosphaericola]|uniref:hypothetical protein n=1 Tax=Actinoallomurus rhizosphaericola TaxID=2952536 RepID=UPI002092C8E6|nr:hypothetical protein [Actinoallomurus rhizosphaericola]MCO5996733.1 hypothetical protein [Actinoallomurus rhizosphaericola]
MKSVVRMVIAAGAIASIAGLTAPVASAEASTRTSVVSVAATPAAPVVVAQNHCRNFPPRKKLYVCIKRIGGGKLESWMTNDKKVKGALGFLPYKANGTPGKPKLLKKSPGAKKVDFAGYKCPQGYATVATWWQDKYQGHTNKWYSAAIKCK